jgi:hypothetical protein
MGSVTVEVFEADSTETLIDPFIVDSHDTTQNISIPAEKQVVVARKTSETPLELTIKITPVKWVNTAGEKADDCPNKFKLMRVACY